MELIKITRNTQSLKSNLGPVVAIGELHSYFAALDLASNGNVSQLLFPDWRNPIEKPFLWLGDFHLYIFTNLLRSFFDDDDDDDDCVDECDDGMMF
ncbi:hypothetical protein BVRB_001650 [Beta vulgaris subsp. vulgaris]|uniref:DOG1 domain-containing protein n=1 Tax=Beta vulgaris subsp. vulgaris TaxID=3555 RepID=A0A0J8B4N5_BETVV|nr:hypothetical protein BVRB_001650 [Beta vulgaris subsp. vulgaris]